MRRIRRSLDAESAAILVHAFACIDYCNSVLVATEAPKTTTDRLVVALHWLDIPERLSYKLVIADPPHPGFLLQR